MEVPSEILPHLLVGTIYHARSLSLIKKLGITHVLNVQEGSRFPEFAPYKFLHVPLSDYGISELSEVITECCDFIEDAKLSQGKALLHCRYGMNRSPTIAIGYLIIKEGFAFRDALNLVTSARPIACPHADYLMQLQVLADHSNK